MTRLTASGRYNLQWYEQRINYSSQLFGLNYPWLNNHMGGEYINYLTTNYSTSLVEADLALIASLGITQIRAWAQLESVMDWSGSAYSLDNTYTANLDDFLTRAANHSLQVIVVIGDGKSSGAYANNDGKFRWTFVTSSSAYLSGLTAYVNHFMTHSNILMWELQNEPYANLTFSTNAIASGVTQSQTHTFLLSCYNTVKSIVGSAYVGFSDYEEEQQTEYQMFSSAMNRANLIDDCTDVYSLHIYRKDQSQLTFDYRTLTNKPKWCSEVGSYNYYDPTASTHPIAAYNELQGDGPNGISGIDNSASVRSISAELINADFSLIMPWSISDNNGMILHNSDLSHTVKTLPAWMQGSFNHTRNTASGRNSA